eukprot:gb/GECH01007515.1/.p1 GENE.gb/GECH01007515.1/~~gb/GECH01007515.1/.p1  ORF type:complete len:112 (+),score=30.21 gb/GECH01007515.1/:1-336(+)
MSLSGSNKIDQPENILIFIDLDKELNQLKIKGNSSISIFSILLKLTSILIHTKKKLCSRHRFALAAMTESAFRLTDFTNNAEEITGKLNQIQTQQQFSTFNLSSVFSVICS